MGKPGSPKSYGWREAARPAGEEDGTGAVVGTHEKGVAQKSSATADHNDDKTAGSWWFSLALYLFTRYPSVFHSPSQSGWETKMGGGWKGGGKSESARVCGKERGGRAAMMFDVVECEKGKESRQART
jgi:hypothetical protein